MAFGLAKSISSHVNAMVLDFDRSDSTTYIDGVKCVAIRNPFKLYKTRGLSVYSWNAFTSALILFRFVVRHKWYKKHLVLHFHNGLQFASFTVLDHAFLRRKNLRYVYSHHSPRWMDSRLISIWEKVLAVPTELYALTHAALATFESEAILDSMSKFWKIPKNSIVLPNGVDSDYFKRDNYSEKVEPYGILYAARIKRQKDQLTVVRAFKEVVLQEPKARLLLLGDPEDLGYYKSVKSEVRRLGLSGKVQFNRSVDITSLNKTRARFQIHLVYSSYTGFDVAVGETLSFGAACVFSDIPTLKGIARHRVNCLLVPPASADALASALLYLLRNPAEIPLLGEMARKTAEDALSWKVLSRDFLLALDKTMPDFSPPE